MNIRARHSTRPAWERPQDRARLQGRAPAVWIVALLLLTGAAARAQLENAEDFFNSGAQFYISNNIPAALERTETGLKLYPEDAKLKKLEELLKQQQQQQSRQQQQKNNQAQQNQTSKSQQQQSQNRRQSQDEKQKQQQKQTPPQEQQAKSAAEKPTEQKQAPPRGQMTPQEARRLLDAQKENEQFLQPRPNVPPRSKQPTEDW